MKRLLFFTLLISCHFASSAEMVSGIITDSKNEILPFSSIVVKGTTQGVSANSKGVYSIQLSPGNYTLVCQYIWL